MQLGEEVIWLECSGSIPINPTYIRGLSPCGKYALLGWLRNAVNIQTLKSLDVYHMIPKNDWGLDGIDSNTGDSLSDWVTEYEQRKAVN